MNGDVAPHTLSTGLETQPTVWYCRLPVISGVALQTEFAAFPPHQHHAVDASMGIVTGNATINLSCRMLVDKWTVLFDMTLRAGFRNRADQIECVGSTVSIVTIRALHGAFGNPVMHGKRELRLHRSVTGVTELRLRRFQETVAEPAHVIRSGYDLEELRLGSREFALAGILVLSDEVRRMACVAGNALRRMFGVVESLLQFSRDVARLTAIGILL